MDLPVVGIGIICKRADIRSRNIIRDSTLCYIEDPIRQAIISNHAAPLGITPPLNITSYSMVTPDSNHSNSDVFLAQLKFCQGFILQDGSTIHSYERAIALYAYQHDIPLLGIGSAVDVMQDVICYGPKSSSNIATSYQCDAEYQIDIALGTLLHDIVQRTALVVQHASNVSFTPPPSGSLRPSAFNKQKRCEAIEAADRKFFLGIRFRPEYMFDKDPNNNRIFERFIQAASTV